MTRKEAIEILNDKDIFSVPFGYNGGLKEATDMAVDALGKLEKIDIQIKDIKRNLVCSNNDYLTGYLCALSAVEGMIAGTEDENA